MDSVDELKTIA